jgi:esterase/lipase superfamily enzyme
MQAECTIYSKMGFGGTYITLSTNTGDELVYYEIHLDDPAQSEKEVEELIRMLAEAKKQIPALHALADGEK